MSKSSPVEPQNSASLFEFEVRSQLDMLVFLVALIGVGIMLGPAVGFVIGIVCAGIALITLVRLYCREFH